MNLHHSNNKGRFCGADLLLACAVLTVLLFQTALAQDTIWTRRFDSGVTDWSFGGAVDPFGNIVTLGECRLNPESDTIWILIIKYAPSGETLWARYFDSDAFLDEPYNLAIDAQGNIVIAGIYSYGATGGGQVIKFDRDGNLIWFRRPMISGYDYSVCIDIAIDDSGYIIVNGYCGHTQQPPRPDVLIMKYDAEGNLIWFRTYDMGGELWESASSLFIDLTGDIICTGIIADESSHFDYLTIKFSQDGDTVWSRILDLYPDDASTGIIGDTDGNIYISGWSVLNSISHPVLIKYSPGGETLWARTYDLTLSASISDIGLDSAGNVLLIGHIDDENYIASCLLMNCTPFGELGGVWTYRMDIHTFGAQLSLSGPDVIYLMGSTQDSTGDNPDMFVMKLRYSAGIEMPSEWGIRDATFRLMNPNPVRAGQAVRLFVQRAGDYRVIICDVSGREVVNIYSDYLNAGVNSVGFAPLPAGVYVLLLESGNYKAQARLVIVR